MRPLFLSNQPVVKPRRKLLLSEITGTKLKKVKKVDGRMKRQRTASVGAQRMKNISALRDVLGYDSDEDDSSDSFEEEKEVTPVFARPCAMVDERAIWMRLDAVKWVCGSEDESATDDDSCNDEWEN